jgi:AcrR family transcriptional regulator
MAQPNHRPRDADATREALIAAARQLFAENGYDSTTASHIAQAAGFSPNLITRYFGGKEGLFLAATRASLNLEATLPGSAAGFGARMADHLANRWEEQGQGDPTLMLLRSATSRPAALQALGDFLERESTEPLVDWLVELGVAEPDAVDRANAIQSFILGTVVTRRMLHTGAVAHASSAELRAWLADVLQRLLGEVPVSRPSDGNLPLSWVGKHPRGQNPSR